MLYDAVVVADGDASVAALANDGYAVHFVAETYKHAKPLAVLGAGDQLVQAARLPIYEASDRSQAPPSKPMVARSTASSFWNPAPSRTRHSSPTW